MAKQYVFTKDIAGSNNGYEVENYNKNQVIEQNDLCEDLFNAWLKAGVIKDLEVGEDVENFLNDEDGNAPLPEGTEIVDEGEAKDGAEDAGTCHGFVTAGKWNAPSGGAWPTRVCGTSRPPAAATWGCGESDHTNAEILCFIKE